MSGFKNSLLSSQIKELDKELILGAVSSKPLYKLSILIKALEYAENKKLEEETTEYDSIIKNLKNTTYKLIKCLSQDGSICFSLKDLNINTSTIDEINEEFNIEGGLDTTITNTKPTLSTNALFTTLCYKNKQEIVLDNTLLLSPFQDADGDVPSKIVFRPATGIVHYVNGQLLDYSLSYDVNEVFTVKFDNDTVPYYYNIIDSNNDCITVSIPNNTVLFNGKDEANTTFTIVGVDNIAETITLNFYDSNLNTTTIEVFPYTVIPPNQELGNPFSYVIQDSHPKNPKYTDNVDVKIYNDDSCCLPLSAFCGVETTVNLEYDYVTHIMDLSAYQDITHIKITNVPPAHQSKFKFVRYGVDLVPIDPLLPLVISVDEINNGDFLIEDIIFSHSGYNYKIDFTISTDGINYCDPVFSYYVNVAEVVNTAPVLDTGTSVDVFLPDNILIQPMIVYDAEGHNTSITNIVQNSGPNTATTGSTNLDITFSNLIEGIYNFDITVTDEFGLSDTENLIVRVYNEFSIDPLKDKIIDNVYTQNSIGVKVNNPSGQSLSYQWVETFRTPTSPASVINTPNSVGSIISNLTIDSVYAYKFTATNLIGITKEVTMTVTVTGSSLLEAGPNTIVNAPVTNHFRTIVFGSTEPIVSLNWSEPNGNTLVFTPNPNGNNELEVFIENILGANLIAKVVVVTDTKIYEDEFTLTFN